MVVKAGDAARGIVALPWIRAAVSRVRRGGRRELVSLRVVRAGLRAAIQDRVRRSAISFALVATLVAAAPARAGAPPASAEPGGLVGAAAPVQPPRPPPPHERGGKSGEVAALLSVGATAAGAGAIVLGGWRGAGEHADGPMLALAGAGLLVVGPSLGHFYAREAGHAVVFSLLRGFSLGAFSAGALTILGCVVSDGCGTRRGLELAGIGLVGGLGYLALTTYDFADAPRAAHRANARALTIAPAPLRTPGGRTAPGLVVAGSF